MKEDEVVEFLKQRPDFFRDHLPLLEELYVPHPLEEGKVISLLERQVELLRNSTADYKKQFQSLVQTARQSDVIVQRSKKVVSESMHCASLDDFSIMVDGVVRNEFAIDHHAILLFSDNPLDTNIPVVSLSSAMTLFGKRLTDRSRCYDELSYRQVRELFPYGIEGRNSFATFPLSYHHQGKEYYLGMLALGSKTDNYFLDNKSLLSLDYFSELLSLILIRLML